jgi:hypothetical protein
MNGIEMIVSGKKSAIAAAAVAGILAAGWASSAAAADIVYGDSGEKLLDPTPVSSQSVDGLNFKAGVVSGKLGKWDNHMFLASVAAPMPFYPSIGVQLDLGIGRFGSKYTSAASGLHIFKRDPSTGMIGIYGDWGYVDTEHGGRVGVEGAIYNGRWSLDAMAGVQFGQHYLTKFVDEVDLSYYFTDNFKGSIGHRLTSRGHVANIGFEFMPDLGANSGWSVYGEAEVGEDNYSGAWAGIRYSFGQSSASTLIERDRMADPIVRIPRNLASLTRCGTGKKLHPSSNGFGIHYTDNICGSAADLKKYGAPEGKLGPGGS